MTARHAAALLGSAVLVFGIFALGVRYALWVRPWELKQSFIGAIMDQDPDVRKQRPLADVEITASNGRFQSHAKSDESGFFSILVPPRTRTGTALTITFVHPGYKPLELSVRPGNQL